MTLIMILACVLAWYIVYMYSPHIMSYGKYPWGIFLKWLAEAANLIGWVFAFISWLFVILFYFISNLFYFIFRIPPV